MDLWIRNQDKDVLTKCDDIRIATADGETKCVIRKHSNNNNWVRLGTYKSKERALQVLDEIQRILHPTLLMSAETKTNDNSWVENGIIYQKYKDNFDIQELSVYVYQMPEE